MNKSRVSSPSGGVGAWTGEPSSFGARAIRDRASRTPYSDTALSYASDGDPDRAIVLLREGLVRAPNNPVLEYNLATLLLERGDYDRAATEFNLVLGSEPDNYRVHYYLGTTYTELNENDKAIAEYNKIPESSDK